MSQKASSIFPSPSAPPPISTTAGCLTIFSDGDHESMMEINDGTSPSPSPSGKMVKEGPDALQYGLDESKSGPKSRSDDGSDQESSSSSGLVPHHTEAYFHHIVLVQEVFSSQYSKQGAESLEKSLYLTRLKGYQQLVDALNVFEGELDQTERLELVKFVSGLLHKSETGMFHMWLDGYRYGSRMERRHAHQEISRLKDEKLETMEYMMATALKALEERVSAMSEAAATMAVKSNEITKASAILEKQVIISAQKPPSKTPGPQKSTTLVSPTKAKFKIKTAEREIYAQTLGQFGDGAYYDGAFRINCVNGLPEESNSGELKRWKIPLAKHEALLKKGRNVIKWMMEHDPEADKTALITLLKNAQPVNRWRFESATRRDIQDPKDLMNLD